jgi:hypothetical protein
VDVLTEHVLEPEVEDHRERVGGRVGLLDDRVADLHARVEIERGGGEAGEVQIVLDPAGQAAHRRDGAALHLGREDQVAIAVAKRGHAEIERHRPLLLVARVARRRADHVLAVAEPTPQREEEGASLGPVSRGIRGGIGRRGGRRRARRRQDDEDDRERGGPHFPPEAW